MPPGNAISVSIRGERVFDYSCGYSDIATKKPMTGKGVFQYLFLLENNNRYYTVGQLGR